MEEITSRFVQVCAQWQQLYQQAVAERDATRNDIEKLRAELAAARASA